MKTTVAALGILSRGFIKKYKLKQNLIKIKLDYIELLTKKHANVQNFTISFYEFLYFESLQTLYIS